MLINILLMEEIYITVQIKNINLKYHQSIIH